MVNSHHLIAGLCLLMASVWTAAGDVGQLRTLQTEQRTNSAALDSLALQRRGLVENADSLSDLISQLKRTDAESTELAQAILSSMALVQRLVMIDHAMDSRTARRNSLTEKLRSAYDWEIGTLIRSLSEELDEGLLHQLIIFQDERHALGEDVVASRMRYPVEMVVEATDGPDAIRQKIELLDGKSGLLHHQLEHVDNRIRQLEEESRMAAKIRHLVEKLWAVESQLQAPRALPLLERRSSEAPVMTPTTKTRGQDMAPPQVSVLPTPNYIVLQIRKLHAKREELSQMKAVVDERILVFRVHLHEMLESSEIPDGRQ